MEVQSKFVPLTRPELFEPNGLPWTTEHQARWAFRKRSENGLAGAFVCIGKRVFVDTSTFVALARKRAV